MAKSSAKESNPRGGAEGLIAEAELVEFERLHPDGLSSAQVVDAFRQRGLKLSEATFRKYVQLGLLPRSRRVGRKGKHQGSMGLYPATVIRRLNDIRRMMAESYTIEEIQRTFPNVKVVKTLNTMWCGLMINPRMIGDGNHINYLCGNEAEAKEKVRALLKTFGWKDEQLLDLGDITNARGTEAVLPIWLRVWGATKTGAFNFGIVR